MKKINAVMASAVIMTALTGCTDATAKLKDASTALFSVGNTSVTKGDVYSNLNSSYGSTVVINNATRYIAQAEVEVTEEMKADAQSTIDSYKTYYGDTFTTYLEQMGMTEEDYINEYLISSLQAEKLITKYIDEKWDDIVASYSPVKATILEFSSQDDANAALSELTDGSKEPAAAAADHNSTSTGTSAVYTVESTELDSMVRTVLSSGTPADGWSMIPETDGSTFVVMRIDDNDPANFRDEAVAALQNVTQISSDSTTYWFRKYGFHVYDKTLYDAIQLDYPDNLVQEMPALEETSETAKTE